MVADKSSTWMHSATVDRHCIALASVAETSDTPNSMLHSGVHHVATYETQEGGVNN